LPRASAAPNERQRIVAAIAELAHEREVGKVEVSMVCTVAGVGLRAFYGHFPTIEDCRKYAFAKAFDHLCEGIARGGDPAEWPRVLDASLTAFFAAIAADPLLAELCLLHSQAVPEEAAGHDREAVVNTLVALLREGRAAAASSAPAQPEPPPLTEELLARALVSLATQGLLLGDAEELPAYKDELLALILQTLCPES
jgi:AcrR family transcriptional regulator